MTDAERTPPVRDSTVPLLSSDDIDMAEDPGSPTYPMSPMSAGTANDDTQERSQKSQTSSQRSQTSLKSQQPVPKSETPAISGTRAISQASTTKSQTSLDSQSSDKIQEKAAPLSSSSSDPEKTSPTNGIPGATLESEANSTESVDSRGNRKIRWWENKPHTGKPVDGPYGWVVVAASCVMLMFAMGVVNAYGAYETQYQVDQFKETPVSTLMWIGTLEWTAMNFVSIPAGILCERLDTRLVTFVGGVIMGAALIAASFCDDAVWKLLLTQGIVFGVGSSLVYIPATTIPSQWFDKHRPLALGLAVSGSGIGGLWLTPATNSMIQQLGTQWSLRITGIVVVAVNSVCSIFMRNRFRVPSRDKLVDLSVMRDTRFEFLFAGVICAVTAYFTPFFHMPTFSVLVLGKSASFGNNMLTAINAASTVGRIATGRIAMTVGTMNTLVVCTFLAGLSVLILWLPFESAGTLIACAVCYGFFCGGFISLCPVIIAQLWGVQRISTIVGLVYIASFIGGMVGAPASGAILDNIGHRTNYKPTIIFAGVSMMGAFMFFFFMRAWTSMALFKKV
ncbi:hypothetical protein LPJ59_001098 [Coemansia sp. RSA 2399]|nr:hypothetical protein LPJ59_001098 [Coemansia sp. RSA 2399]KAJ1907035.1 hypothetical protein LPJ81_001010 [Coemansia sp. IMI 209127]